MIVFWKSLSIEQQLELVKQIVPTLSIVIGAIISISIFLLTKKKEINFKVHEQRKIKYENYLELFKKSLINREVINDGKLPFEHEEWMDMQIGLILYGSDKVVKKINELNDIARYPNDDKNILVALGELMHLMRKEVGLTNKKVSIRDSLSLIITDIKDPQFDKWFPK